MTDPIDPPEIDPFRGDPSRADPSIAQPPPGAPAPGAPSPDSAPLGWLGRHLGGLPSSRPGAARADAVPRMETVRITAPDLARRAALRKTRRRLGLTAIGFALLFLTVAGKLTVATVIAPRLPRPDAVMVLPSQAKSSSLFASQSATQTAGQLTGEPTGQPPGQSTGQSTGQPAGQPAATGALDHRATIVDRNGQPLAISLPSVALFADPRQIIDPVDATRRLKQALPRIDAAAVQRRLSDTNLQFAFVERQITPREELAVNRLGIPGVDFRPSEVRRYPMGRVVSQVLGGVDVDNHGAAGAEKSFDHRLLTDPNDLRLSVDVRVQAVVRDELSKAMAEFGAIGACGIVMDVNTGEILGMVSLPDYDPNAFKTSTDDEQFNRAITGRYEPGSTFKLQTASMALDGGIVHIWDEVERVAAAGDRPLHHHRFRGKHRWLGVPAEGAHPYSSNLGAHISQWMSAPSVSAPGSRRWADRTPADSIRPARSHRNTSPRPTGGNHGDDGGFRPRHRDRAVAGRVAHRAWPTAACWCARPSGIATRLAS